MSEYRSSVSEEERMWGFIAWLLSVVGAVLVLAIRPDLRYAKYWAYLSISFFIVAVASGVVCGILSLVPFIGHFLSILIGAALLILWVLGIVKSLAHEYWKPPIIYGIAVAIGIDKI